MSAADACRLCRFSKTYGAALRCRRYPPQAAAVSIHRVGSLDFPQVQPDEWCGEFMGRRPGTSLPAKTGPGPQEKERERLARLRAEADRDFDEGLMPGGFS